MRVAVIDVGTNTFNILIADVGSSKDFSPVFRTKTSVQLGEKSINKNLITPEAATRGLRCMTAYKEICDKLGAKKIYAFATSAVRNSKNGKQFVQKVKDIANIDITVISGEKEAEYIYYGVRNALKVGTEPSLILDIGGGSNEFIIGTSDAILWKQSYDLGMARLLEKFKPSNPITKEQIITIEKYLKDSMETLVEACSKYNIQELIGSAGSFESFAALCDAQATPVTRLNKTEMVFDMDSFFTIHDYLLKTTMEERLKNKAIIPMRATMIVLASIFVNSTIQLLNIKKMRMSTYSLKEGALSLLINKA